METVFDTWAQRDGAEAMRQASAISDPELKQELVLSVICEWGESHPDSILRWSETATGTERGEAILRAGLAIAGKDPAAGAAIVASLLKENSLEGDGAPSSPWIVGAIAKQWIAADANAAGEWVMRLPQGSVRNDAVKEMVQEWTGIHPMAASQWVASCRRE